MYPHGEYSKGEAREMLDFAIESRKREKLQLIQMDETFEEVEFSYKIQSSGHEITVKTFEVLEHDTPSLPVKKMLPFQVKMLHQQLLKRRLPKDW